MKKKTPQEQLAECTMEIDSTLQRWTFQHKEGCNDPGWPDGVNLNLLHNHMLYYKKKIQEICEKNGFPLPGEFFLPIPPYVDANYFAKPDSKRAIKIIQNYGLCANHKAICTNPFDSEQMVLFD